MHNIAIQSAFWKMIVINLNVVLKPCNTYLKRIGNPHLGSVDYEILPFEELFIKITKKKFLVCFKPFITAFDLIDATSDPPLGSLTPMHVTISPVSIILAF